MYGWIFVHFVLYIVIQLYFLKDVHIVCLLLQHLVWILGLKPSSGGSLKATQQIAEGSGAVITTAVMADLPILSAMLSRLFESSQ